MNLIKKIIIFCLAILLILVALSVTFYLSLIFAFVFICIFIFFKIKKKYNGKRTAFDNYDLKSFLKIFSKKYDIVAYDREKADVIFCNNQKFLNEISHYVYTHSSVNLIKLIAENNIENQHITHETFAGVDVYLKPISEYNKLLKSFNSFSVPVFAVSSDSVIYQNNLAEEYSEKKLLELRDSEKNLLVNLGKIRIYSVQTKKRDDLQDVISSLAFMSCLIGEDGKVSSINNKTTNTNGSISLKLGDNFLEKLDKMSADKIYQFIEDKQQNQLSLESDFKGKTVRRLSLSVVRFKEVYVIQFFDVTAYKKMEDDFIHSQKMQAVGQLAGGIAHDFNNLLTAIIGFCDLLLIRHTPGDPSFSDIMQIKQNAGRSASLVKQILDVSRKQESYTTYIDVDETLGGLSHLIKRLIGVGIDFQLEKEKNLNHARADQSQFEQIIINFIVNARDAIKEANPKEGGRIGIKAKNIDFEDGNDLEYRWVGKEDSSELLPGKYISIEIEDNGTGINKKTLDKIFEPYFSTKKLGQGTGLGLSTVYDLIEKFGGFLAVQTQVGKGTTFTILLKAESASVVKEKTVIQNNFINSDITGNETILLIEDEDPVRLFASHALENKGYNVLQASSAEEGVEVIEQNNAKIDLIVTDVIMPGMDGTMLLKIMKDKGWDIKIIFISGYALDSLPINIEDNAKVEFLAKPFNLKDLVLKVRSALNSPKSQ